MSPYDRWPRPTDSDTDDQAKKKPAKLDDEPAVARRPMVFPDEVTSAAPRQKPVRMPTDENTVSLSAPSPIVRRGRVVPRAAVNLRAATSLPKSTSVATQSRANVVAQLKETGAARRQTVWTKLDEARRYATNRLARLRNFVPVRAEGSKG
jgi:hypothetical protein